MDETKKIGIDEKLNRLLKNVTDDYFAKDEVDEDEDYISEDEIADTNDDEITYDFSAAEPEEEIEGDEEIEEDDELEKAEEDEIAEDEEAEPEAEVEEEPEAEEQVEEEDEDVEEVEYDDLLERVREDLGLDEINGRLDDLTANLSKVVDLLEINNDNANEAVKKNVELEKSIKLLTKKLSKNENLRKSVKNAQVFNKYEEEKKTYKDLTKSQRAEILASELLAGRKGVTATDVSKAEQGAQLSKECIAIIEKHL